MSGTKPKAWMSWSSGKDSAWALHLTMESGEVDVVRLLTTVTETYARVSMHGVREALLDKQAESIGLPLHKVLIPSPCSNEIYEDKMRQAMAEARAEGVTHVIFGDVSLGDIRKYREEKLAGVGMTALFPLWGKDASGLAREMIGGGLRAFVVCLDPRKTPKEFAGREFNREFLDELPNGIDPCAENGEFHTVVVDGPMFSKRIEVVVGETVEREGFVFTDVIPV